MAEAAKDQDQSMEDILQSIKRIIAEENEPVPASQGSDVLELTELLAEDGSVSHAKSDERGEGVKTMSIDEIMAAPISSAPLAAQPRAPEAVVPPAPMPAPTPAPAVVAAPAPVAEKPPEPQPTPVVSEEPLISGETLSSSVAALNALRNSMAAPAPAPRADGLSFRSGTTVEDLVREAIKPMLKDWMDHNLSSIVEALVKKEISKLTQG